MMRATLVWRHKIANDPIPTTCFSSSCTSSSSLCFFLIHCISHYLYRLPANVFKLQITVFRWGRRSSSPALLLLK